MPRKFSLTKKKDFDYAFKTGSRTKTPICLIISTNQQPIAGHPRFGIMVSKKNFATAVQRNKIKRQIREILRDISKTNSSFSTTNKDFAIIINSNFAKNTFTQNQNLLVRAINSLI